MKSYSTNFTPITLAFLLCLVMGLTEADRQSAGRRLEQPPGGAKVFKSKCGSADEVSRRVGLCLVPIFDMVEGKMQYPTGDRDIVGHCDRFSECERCIRQITKECLTGLHKTAVGTVATATKRFKTQECKTEATRARYMEPLKCAIKKGKEMSGVLRNHTNIAQAVRDLPITPEEKLLRACCLLTSIDRELETRYNRECPDSTSTIMRIVHAMTDDVRATLCRNPRCAGALDVDRSTRYTAQQNILEPYVQILLQISTD